MFHRKRELQKLEAALGHPLLDERRRINRCIQGGGCPAGYPYSCADVEGLHVSQRKYCTKEASQCKAAHAVNNLSFANYRKKYKGSSAIPPTTPSATPSAPLAPLAPSTTVASPSSSPAWNMQPAVEWLNNIDIPAQQFTPAEAVRDPLDDWLDEEAKSAEDCPAGFPYKCADVPSAYFGQRGFCAKQPDQCRKSHEANNLTTSNYRKRVKKKEPPPPEPSDPNQTILSLDLPKPEWSTRPGEPGFNQEATQHYTAAGLHSDNPSEFFIKCPSRPPPGQAPVYEAMAYQKTVPFVVYPGSPVDRMLVVHRTGAGKTFTMVMVLDNFFHDPRPKVIIFPTQSVMNNFYGELLKFPNRFANHCRKHLPRQVKMVEAAMSGKQVVGVGEARRQIVDLLAMKGKLSRAGKPGELAAPLRAYRYTQAGGSAIVAHRPPTDPIFKKGFRGLAYNNKIVLMDEVHNLVVPSPDVEKYKDKLQSLARQLSGCTGSVVVGFTATPMKSKREEGERLLGIIKGPGSAGKNHEGYVSWFNSMPLSTFPEMRPCNKYLGNIIRVKMEGQNAKLYKSKHGKRGKHGTHHASISNKTLLRLQNYCNGPYQTQFNRLGNKFSSAHAANHATKLYHIAMAVAQSDEKCLIIIHRAAGYRLMVKMMESIVQAECGPNPGGGCWIGVYERGSEATSKIEQFNNKTNKGQVMKAMVIDAKEFSEGVSFKGVRRLILVNPPFTYADYKQRIGRALRSCDRPLYSDSERTVDVDIYVATHPDIVDTADEIALLKMYHEKIQIEKDLGELFRDVAVDAQVLRGVALSSDTTCALPQHRTIE